MKTRKLKIGFSTSCAVALLGATNALATAYTSTGGGGNWNSSSTWTPAGVPGASDSIAIAAGDPVSVSDMEAVSAITIQKGATLTIATGGNLTVSGTVTQSGGSSGTATLTLAGGSGTLNLNDATTAFSSVTLTPGTSGSTVDYGASGTTVYAAAYDNLTLSGGGAVAVNSTTTAINLMLSNATTLSNGANKLASITGNLTLNDTCSFTVTGNNSETIGGSVTLNSRSTFTKTANTAVGGNFTVNNSASYFDNNGNTSLTVDGSVYVSSTATFGFGSSGGNNSTLALAGSGQTISGGGTLTCQLVTVNGSYTLQSGTTLSVGNKNAGISPSLGGTGSLANQGTLSVNYSAAFSSAVTISSLNCSATGNTLVLNGSGTTTLPAIACYNLTLNPTGLIAFNLGSLTAIGGNLTFGGSNGNTSLVSAWPGSGITGEVIMNSSKGITFPTATFSIGGLNQSAGTVTVPSGGSLIVTGTGATAFTRTGGTFSTAAGSTVSFTGAIPIIGGTVGNSFGNLSIASGTTATNLEPLVITNTLSVATSGVLDVTALGTYTLSTTQTVVNSGTLVGNISTAANSDTKIYAETNDVFSTNTITGSLAFSGNDSVNLNLNYAAAAPNDQLAVGGTLTLNNTVFNLNAPSAGATIDTVTPYILATAQGISGTPVLNWVTAPANSANYSLVVEGNSVVLQYNGSANLAPTITSILPNFGSTNGGTFVTINGANFLSNPQVTFGGLSANNITYVNSSEITVTTPAQTPGTVTVTVTDTDSQTATGSYTYVLPPQPAIGTVTSTGANSETLVWTGGANENCVLMMSTNLSAPNWTAVKTNSVGASGLSTNVISINPSQPMAFYELGIPYN